MSQKKIDEVEHTFSQHFPDGQYRILNVYLFGSRLYNCHTEDSDYDLIVIVDGFPYFADSVLIDSDEGLSLNVFHVDFFQDVLGQHLIAMVLCLYVPEQFIWKQERNFEFEVQIRNLRRGALQDGGHNFAKAKRLWSEGEFKKSKKNLVHGLRYLDFACQLAERGEIYDIHKGNTYWKDIMEDQFDTWQPYEEKYRPIYQKLFHYIEHSFLPRIVPISFSPSTSSLSNVDHPLETIRYLSTYGLHSLRKEYSIDVEYDEKFPSLIMLKVVPFYSPDECNITHECWNGLILEILCNGEHVNAKSILDKYKSGKEEELDSELLSWRVVSHSFVKSVSYDASQPKQSQSLSKSNNSEKIKLIAQEKIEGILVTLYSYRGEWRVVTKESISGKDSTSSFYYSKYSYRWWKKPRLESKRENDKIVPLYNKDEEDTKVTSYFNEMFWSIWKKKGYSMPKSEEYCYSFQMVSPLMDSTVRCYHEDDLVLVGVRHLVTLREIDPVYIGKVQGWNFPKTFEVSDYSEVHRLYNELIGLDPLDGEGYSIAVIKQEDSNNNSNNVEESTVGQGYSVVRRVSVISQQYSALDTLRKENTPFWKADLNTNERLMLDIIRSKSSDRFVTRFPHLKNLYQEYKLKYDTFIEHVSSVITRLQQLDDRSVFAAEARKYSFYAVIFEFRDEGISTRKQIEDYFALCAIRKVQVLMKKAETK